MEEDIVLNPTYSKQGREPRSREKHDLAYNATIIVHTP